MWPGWYYQPLQTVPSCNTTSSTSTSACAHDSNPQEPSTSDSAANVDRIGESAKNRFGRPYISGRPLLSFDRRRIIHLYNQGVRKIAIARELGITHSCVSKVIRRFEETGEVEGKSARTASCACPGSSEDHDPAVCRHVKFKVEQQLAARANDVLTRTLPTKPRKFTVEWILSDECPTRAAPLSNA